jgi:RND family efflux transporter MFP subunit
MKPIGIGIAIAALALLTWVGQGRSEAGVAAPATVLPVVAHTVRITPSYGVDETHTGRVVARRTSALGFEQGGRLERVLADDGDRVEAGDVLAQLDQRQLHAERKQRAAQLADLDAQLALARVTTGRMRALRASDHVSPAQFDEAVHGERALVARRAAAQAALEATDVALALSEIRAPYAGQVTVRLVDEGTVVAPGQAILHLIEDGVLELRVGVPPDAADALEIGTRLPVEIEGRRQHAVLHAVVDSVGRDTRTVTAILSLDVPPDPEAGSALRDGAVVRVALPREIEGEGAWLPLSALAESHRGLWSAYALVADAASDPALRRVERRPLEVLYADSERAYVRGTLRDGDEIAASGVHRLVPGQEIRVERPTPAAAAGTASTAGTAAPARR